MYTFQLYVQPHYPISPYEYCNRWLFDQTKGRVTVTITQGTTWYLVRYGSRYYACRQNPIYENWPCRYVANAIHAFCIRRFEETTGIKLCHKLPIRIDFNYEKVGKD